MRPRVSCAKQGLWKWVVHVIQEMLTCITQLSHAIHGQAIAALLPVRPSRLFSAPPFSSDSNPLPSSLKARQAPYTQPCQADTSLPENPRTERDTQTRKRSGGLFQTDQSKIDYNECFNGKHKGLYAMLRPNSRAKQKGLMMSNFFNPAFNHR